MAVIIRIDVDRPFGKRNIFRQVLSKFASELYLPAVNGLGYLRDLEEILLLLNRKSISSYVFFRRCTLPSLPVMSLMKAGNHVFGLHLENSRSLDRFRAELRKLEKHVAAEVRAFSKHGSGRHRYGLYHYAPYEPEKYQNWGAELGMRMFLGNLEDPSLEPYIFGEDLCVFPAAFWLEPTWRDAKRFGIDWLCRASSTRDIVLLLHPDNVTADHHIMTDLLCLIDNCKFSVSVDS